MKQHPILFSTEMVKAILEGRKTQTRRVSKHQYWTRSEVVDVNVNGLTQKIDRNVSCPYGQVGDVLWVREAFQLVQPYGPEEYFFGYKDGSHSDHEASEKYDYITPYEWKPSIHMPKEACRIYLQIKELRAERLQDITEEDAIREGVRKEESLAFNQYLNYVQGIYQLATAKESFNSLWNDINGPLSWDANPWVWVIGFKKVGMPQGYSKS